MDEVLRVNELNSTDLEQEWWEWGGGGVKWVWGGGGGVEGGEEGFGGVVEEFGKVKGGELGEVKRVWEGGGGVNGLGGGA